MSKQVRQHLKQLGRAVAACVLALTTIGGLGACSNVTAGQTLKAPVQYAMAPVVQVVTPEGAGSGFYVVTPYTIATAAHVVGNQPVAAVTAGNGKVALATVLYRDREADFALLAIDVPGRPLAVRTSPLLDGEPVAALGYPQGRAQMAASTGTVQAIHPAVLMHDALMASGSSGGPLVDADNRVVGVNVLLRKVRRDRGNALDRGFAVRIEVVLRRLAAAVG